MVSISCTVASLEYARRSNAFGDAKTERREERKKRAFISPMSADGGHKLF